MIQSNQRGDGMSFIYSPTILQCMHFKHPSCSAGAVRKVMDYEFDFCVGCDREMWIDGQCHKLEKGCFVIRKPGQIVHANGSYDCYMLTLDFSNRKPSESYSRNEATKMQEEFSSPIWDILPSVFKPAHYDDYVRIFESLISANHKNTNKTPDALARINELLHLVVSDAYLSGYPLNNKTKTPIDEVYSFIKSHYSEDITLDTLASVAHLNKNYLVRRFKKTFGISPISFLIKVRMDYAKKLLSESNLPIKTVAAMSGYNDPSFFNFCFKKSFDISPAKYRALRQTNNR